jgi:hypothetical protein
MFLFLSCSMRNTASSEVNLLTPNPSETPRIINSEIKTVSPPFTPVPLPSLTTEEQMTYIKNLLEPNIHCQLPCWWGVVPGVTSWQESKNLLFYLGGPIREFQTESGRQFRAARFSGLPEINLNFIKHDATSLTVDEIIVSGNRSGNQDQSDFEIFWELYSPKEIMMRYGVPSRIVLDTTGIIGLSEIGKHGYTLWVFYETLGFMIRYDGLIADSPTFRFCFELKEGVGDIYRIILTLQNPKSPLPLEWDDSILRTNPLQGMSIQDVSGMNNEEFHSFFTQSKQSHCFYTPHEIWPMR